MVDKQTLRLLSEPGKLAQIQFTLLRAGDAVLKHGIEPNRFRRKQQSWCAVNMETGGQQVRLKKCVSIYADTY